MPSSRQNIGQLAEAFVSHRLSDLGWALIAQNLRTPYAEVDLFLRDAEQHLVIVEVKARSFGAWLADEDCLGPRQRQRLFRAAEWLERRHQSQSSVRIDLALVDLLGGRAVDWRLLKHIGLN